jgi:hypothetical protein
MLRFCGFDLELFVEEVLDRRDWPTLCSARDFRGGRWLIVQVDDDPDRLAWMCVPVSARAIRAVRDGRYAPADVLRHSPTGTVELVTVEYGRAVADRSLLCECLSWQLPPSADHLLAVAA